jgi:hypothetical protein
LERHPEKGRLDRRWTVGTAGTVGTLCTVGTVGSGVRSVMVAALTIRRTGAWETA